MGIEFDLYGCVDVNGNEADQLLKWFKSQKVGSHGADLRSNFSKSLVDKNGNMIKRYEYDVMLKDIEGDISEQL